jgi:hypothetical protein
MSTEDPRIQRAIEGMVICPRYGVVLRRGVLCYPVTKSHFEEARVDPTYCVKDVHMTILVGEPHVPELCLTVSHKTGSYCAQPHGHENLHEWSLFVDHPKEGTKA